MFNAPPPLLSINVSISGGETAWLYVMIYVGEYCCLTPVSPGRCWLPVTLWSGLRWDSSHSLLTTSSSSSSCSTCCCPAPGLRRGTVVATAVGGATPAVVAGLWHTTMVVTWVSLWRELLVTSSNILPGLWTVWLPDPQLTRGALSVAPATSLPATPAPPTPATAAVGTMAVPPPRPSQ